MKLQLTNILLIMSNIYFGQNLQWAKSIGGPSSEYSRSIVTDLSGNIYTTGYFQNISDFDPGVGTYTLAESGSNDMFISKLDPSGAFLWAKRIGGSLLEEGVYITIDANGNSYTTGRFFGSVDFDPSSGTNILTSQGSDDIFILKLDASGNFVWAKSIGGSGNDDARSIVVDGSGNVYTTGRFQVSVDFDPGVGTFSLTSLGNSDVFISKLDAIGNFVWAKSVGGTSGDVGTSIKFDGFGNVYTTGTFQGLVDFDPGAGVYNLTSIGVADIFISKIAVPVGLKENTYSDIIPI